MPNVQHTGYAEGSMAEWVRLCALNEAPGPGSVLEADAQGVAICLANVDGKLAALDNWCPHRRGPLGMGWVEGRTVVCPLHAWAFDVETGDALPPDSGKVNVFPVRVDGENLLIDLG